MTFGPELDRELALASNGWPIGVKIEEAEVWILRCMSVITLFFYVSKWHKVRYAIARPLG